MAVFGIVPGLALHCFWFGIAVFIVWLVVGLVLWFGVVSFCFVVGLALLFVFGTRAWELHKAIGDVVCLPLAVVTCVWVWTCRGDGVEVIKPTDMQLRSA